jgi:Flp pilus assembly protein TadG
MRRDEPDLTSRRPWLDPRRARRRRRAGERGQSTVELALVLPVVLVLALVLVQVGLVVRDQVRVTHAAREGSRAAAVDPDPAAARRAVERGAGFAPDQVDVTSRGRAGVGSAVTVEVRSVSRTELPLIGPLLPDLVLHGEATMRVER